MHVQIWLENTFISCRSVVDDQLELRCHTTLELWLNWAVSVCIVEVIILINGGGPVMIMCTCPVNWRKVRLAATVMQLYWHDTFNIYRCYARVCTMPAALVSASSATDRTAALIPAGPGCYRWWGGGIGRINGGDEHWVHMASAGARAYKESLGRSGAKPPETELSFEHMGIKRRWQMSSPSGAFSAARSRSPTTAFDSTGLRHVAPTFPHFPPRCSLRGWAPVQRAHRRSQRWPGGLGPQRRTEFCMSTVSV